MTSMKGRLATVVACALVVVGAGVDAGAEGTTTPTSGRRSLQRQQARRTITITPRSGPRGTVVTVRGTGCMPPRGAKVAITRNGIEEEGAQFAVPDENGTWSERQTIPGANRGSTYAVVAYCFHHAGIHFSYPPQRFDLTRPAPRARPMPARPTFTG